MFTVDLKIVSGFTNITTFQIPVIFDKNVLELIAVENLAPIANPAQAAGVNYNINLPSSNNGNKIVFLWATDQSTQPGGATLPDGTTWATLRFNVKASGTVKVEVKSVPPSIEVTRGPTLVPVPVTFSSATTTVTAGSGGGGGAPLQGFKIVANTVNIPKGQTTCMPVTVNKFDSIIAMQYAMHWDPAVLTYECIKGINLPGLTSSDFASNNAAMGLLTIAWGDPAGGVTGVTRANGTTIYEVCFKGTGNNSAQSLVTIDGIGLPQSAGGAEAANVAGKNLATTGFGVADTLFVNPAVAPANAVTFSAEQKEVAQNGISCVEIRGKGFSSIVAAELPIVYDTMMLRLQSIQVGANPLVLATSAIPNANFSQSFVAGQSTGTLRFVWANPNGTSLASDTSTIFRVCFRAKGAINSVTPVTLGGGVACAPVSAYRKDAGSRPVALVSGSITVKNAAVIFNAAPAVINVGCFGAATGSISVAPSGCAATYAYAWSNAQTNATSTALVAGTYTVTVSCSSGGSATASATVTQPATAVSAGTPATTNANCPGTAGGSITLAPTGGLVPYRYSWVGPSFSTPNNTTAPTVTNVRAGNYTVTVTDERNCTTTTTVTVTAIANSMSLTAAQIAKTNANCSGIDGSITLSPSGGTTPYAFSWANSAGSVAGAITNALTNIPVGNYNATVTDANACSVTAVQINVPVTVSPVTIPAPATVSPTCAATNGSITVNPANGATPYSYVWTKGGIPITNQFGNVLSGAASGSYVITVTDANGCTATTTVSLSSGQGAVAATAVTTPSSCFTPSAGAINLTPSGGLAPYKVTWSGPGGYTSTATSPTGLPGGNYRAVVTDGNGCAFTTPDFVVAGPTEALGFNGNPTVKNPLCPGASTGEINITAKGGTSSYTYAWTGPNNFTNANQNLTALAGGTYTVTIKDANQCTFAAPVVVTAPPTINPGSTVTNAACGNNGAIQLNPTGGTAPFTYQWTGPNAFNATQQNINNLRIGDYQLTIRDAAGCTFTPTAPIALTGSANPLALTATPINAKCANENTGGVSLAITGGGQISNYSWVNTASPSPISTAPNLANVAPGVYNCVVTDVNGCTASLPTPITVSGPQSPLAVTLGPVTGASCPEAAQGSIALVINGGWGAPYNVVWSSTSLTGPNPANIAPGNYTPTVTDAGGCVLSVAPITVPGPPVLTITSTKVDSVSCAGTADGKITINVSGGNGGVYSAVWNGGILSGTTISNLGGKRTYSPTVSDKDGCTKVFAPIFVYEPDTMKVTTVMTQQSGVQANGAINITVTGGTKPYKYEWKRPDGTLFSQTEDINSLAAGIYEVVITDAKSCGVIRLVEVTQDNPLALAKIDTVKNACENDACISIIIPVAAQGPFVIRWNNGGTMTTPFRQFSICSLKPGIYNITLTDVASTRTFELPATEVRQLDRAAFGSSITCPDEDKKNGNIFLNPIPQSAPITFSWNNGAFGPVRIALDSGLYIVTARHLLSGCTAMDTFSLTRKYPALAVAPVNFKNESCGGKSDGAITLNVSGGNNVGGYTYKWTGPNSFIASTPAISSLAPGIYVCTITDASSKTFVFDTTIVALSSLKVTNVNEISNYNAFQVSGFGKCDGVAEAVALGGAGALTYQWSNSIATQRNTTLCGGAYGLTITDALGCTAVWADALTSPDQIASPVQFTKLISCTGRCDASARVTIAGGLSPYKVSWSVDAGVVEVVNSTGASTERLNLCPGNYSLTITDRNDAVQITTITVAPKDPIVVAINDDIIPTSFSDCDGELLASASGTTGSVLYAWASNRGNRGAERRAENLCPGEIVTFIITDGNGCVATVFDTVPNPENGCLEARPVITPGQQDGKNDVFIIACAEEYQNSAEIYNRWGQLVFQTDNYDNSGNSWSGTTRNGDPLPEGVYFYVFNFTDGGGTKQQLKGYVNLLR